MLTPHLPFLAGQRILDYRHSAWSVDSMMGLIPNFLMRGLPPRLMQAFCIWEQR